MHTVIILSAANALALAYLIANVLGYRAGVWPITDFRLEVGRNNAALSGFQVDLRRPLYPPPRTALVPRIEESIAYGALVYAAHPRGARSYEEPHYIIEGWCATCEDNVKNIV